MRYVGLLRAVNVGKRQVSMAALRELLEGLGHTDVQTVLQSGNVVFEAPRTKATDLEATSSKAIEAEFGFPVPVLIRTGKQLDAVIEANPFPDATPDPTTLHVAFSSRPVTAKALAGIDADRFAPDEFRAGHDEVYLRFPNGSGRSKLSIQVFEKALGADLTARNWNTVVKLRDLASGP